MKHFISKLFKEKKLFELNVSYHDKDEEYHLLSFITGTAFYIGTGRFVTSFHLILEENKQKAYSNLIILYKDKIIHIDKGFQYESISDLLVLHSSSEEVKDLVPLRIEIPHVKTYGDIVSVFDYEHSMNVDIKIPQHSFFSKKDEYEQIFIPSLNVKHGMSGSPLLYQGKVIGILCSVILNHLKFACFTSSLNLLNLLKTFDLSQDIDKSGSDGVKRMISESESGNGYASKVLKMFLYSNEYVLEEYIKNKFLKYSKKNKS